MKRVRIATLMLVAGCTFSACADFTSEGMTGGLGSNEGTTDAESGSSSSSSGDVSGTKADMPATSTGEVGDDSDEDSSDGDDSAAASTGIDETTGPLTGFQDGTYEGVLNILMVSSFGNYNCVGTMTLTVTEDDGPPVLGDGSCVVDIPVVGPVTGVMELTGELALPLTDGTATLTTDLDSTQTTWAGAIAGNTFTGSFNGVYMISGYQVNYTGDWTTER